MPRMVLLLHTLPDGSSHYDWMIDPPTPRRRDATGQADPDARDLLTFRVQERIDLPRVKEFSATRIENHRRLYLTFEGEIGPAVAKGPSRGTVKRVARGRVARFLERADGQLEIHGTFGPRGNFVWRGKPDARVNTSATPEMPWIFSCSPAPKSPFRGNHTIDLDEKTSRRLGNW